MYFARYSLYLDSYPVGTGSFIYEAIFKKKDQKSHLDQKLNMSVNQSHGSYESTWIKKNEYVC